MLVQLENLRVLPLFSDRPGTGRLRLSGWVFKIEAGEVFAYDPETEQFGKLPSA